MTEKQEEFVDSSIRLATSKILKLHKLLKKEHITLFTCGGQLRMTMLGQTFDITKIHDGIILPLVEEFEVGMLFNDEWVYRTSGVWFKNREDHF